MKKILLVLVAMLVTVTVWAQDFATFGSISYNNSDIVEKSAAKVIVSDNLGLPIDSFNFPDENFRSWLLTRSYGSDGWLTDEEIASVTSIDVHSKNITDLTGIEHFTALTELHCGFNQLTSLDVSQNTALTNLYCFNNQLTALDVSHNLALGDLRCNNNQLTALDLSQNSALGYLDCSQNQLTTLDMSHNPELGAIQCFNNQLTMLDLSQNPNLGTIMCNNNRLTSLDVSNKPALAYVSCYENRINGVNMENLVAGLPTVPSNEMTDYGYFFAIAPYSSTEQNVITTTQVATATAKHWYVFDDGGAEYGGSEPIALGLPIDSFNFPDENFRNWLLTRSYGSDGWLTDEEIASVTSIDVHSKNITDLTGIEHFTALTELHCGFNQLTALDVSQNTALTNLYCFNNQLTALDVSHNLALGDLRCNNNQLTALDLSQNSALGYLDCSQNQLTTLDMSHNPELGAIQCFNNQLTMLDLSQNPNLGTIMCNNNRLTSLDVSNKPALAYVSCYENRINGVNMENLVAGLPTVPSNEMTDYGYFFAIAPYSSTEQNVITTTQVATVTAKHWYVFDDGGAEYGGSEPTAVPGDVNGDGSVTAADVTAIYDYLLNGDLTYIDTLDVNGDGVVTSADVTMLYDIMLGNK